MPYFLRWIHMYYHLNNYFLKHCRNSGCLSLLSLFKNGMSTISKDWKLTQVEKSCQNLTGNQNSILNVICKLSYSFLSELFQVSEGRFSTLSCAKVWWSWVTNTIFQQERIFFWWIVAWKIVFNYILLKLSSYCYYLHFCWICSTSIGGLHVLEVCCSS